MTISSEREKLVSCVFSKNNIRGDIGGASTAKYRNNFLGNKGQGAAQNAGLSVNGYMDLIKRRKRKNCPGGIR